MESGAIVFFVAFVAFVIVFAGIMLIVKYYCIMQEIRRTSKNKKRMDIERENEFNNDCA